MSICYVALLWQPALGLPASGFPSNLPSNLKAFLPARIGQKTLHIASFMYYDGILGIEECI